MNTLEIVELEQLLNDEPGCESTHLLASGARIDCSHTVVARKIPECGIPFNICQNSAGLNRVHIANGGPCLKCGRPASECWRIIPI